MRYLLGALVLAAGCGPQAVPTDAPPAQPLWERCSEACQPHCDDALYEVTCEDVVGGGADCSGCIPACTVPRLFDADAAVPELVMCEPGPASGPTWTCPGVTTYSRIGVCYRPR